MRDNPAGWGVEGLGLADDSAIQQLIDVSLRDVPELEAPARGFEQIISSAFHVGKRAIAGGVPVASRDQQLFLGRDQFGRVEFEQRLSALDHLALVLDVELLDPALDLDVDVLDQALVVRHAPDCTHHARQVPPFDENRPHTHVLDHPRVDPHCACGQFVALFFADGQ